MYQALPSAKSRSLLWQIKIVKKLNNLRRPLTEHFEAHAVFFAFVQAMKSHAFNHVFDDERCPENFEPGTHKLQRRNRAFNKQ